MTGVAALAICAAFTSCSKSGEELYNPEAISGMNKEKVVEEYNARFLAYVGGSIASDQDWGFGSAGTRTENANANEWADPNKAYGGLLVPPAITPTQAAVVKTYFQTHDKLGYQDPGWSNYFIQQVYKGHTSVPEGCATPEAYFAADGANYILASDHMDHLIAVDPEKGIYDHINNFNHGDCSANGSVLDNGGNANDGPFHTDKIMYMMNSTTKSFGYHNSDGSLYHTEYTGLVGWETIHNWALSNYPGYDGCLKDDWNRSYMGFDFEQMVGSDVYAKGVSRPDATGNWQWYPDEYKTFEFDGKTYNFLSANMNMYAADRTENSYVQKNGSTSTSPGKANFNDRPSDAIIRDLISKGYLPYSDTLKDWVKVGGTADGYFSDWIVTLTEAKTDTPPTPPTRNYTIRVLGEDLTFANTSSASGVAITDADDGADFDFNDVVFDVAHVSNGTADENGTWIRLMAAGGTLPLYIGSVAEANEVHYMFGQPITKMINTNAPSGISGLDPIEYKYSNGVVNAKDIAIIVIKDGIQFTLSAQRGEPASKIAVSKMDFQWPNERQSIKKKYPLFVEWAQGGQKVSDWWD